MSCSRWQMNLIAAQCRGGGIGKDNALPWNIPSEYAHFARMTRALKDASKRNVVLMGRKTWDSIGGKPLKGRLNVVLSRNPQPNQEGVMWASSLEEAVTLLREPPLLDSIETVWICGGENVYREAMDRPECHRIYLTQIDADVDCDTFFPSMDESRFELVSDPRAPQGKQSENGFDWECHVWQKRRE